MYFRFNGKDTKEWRYDLKASLVIEPIESIEGERISDTNKYKEKFIRIRKVDKVTEETMKFNKIEIDTINRWLFEEDFKCLQVGKYCYNAIFKRRSRMWFNNEGFLDLKVKLYPNALSNVIVYNVGINNGEKAITIDNKSNVTGLKINTELQIKLMDNNATNIAIRNLTLNKTTGFNSLEKLDNIYVNGKNEYIISKVDSKRDIYSKFNGEYLRLTEGINEIRISSNGFIKVSIAFQQELNLEEVWLR